MRGAYGSKRLPVGLVQAAIAVAACSAGLSSNGSNHRPDEPRPRLALLVGVQQYPNLPPAKQLDGSVNDVRAMKALLIERFQFRPDDIVTLIDQQATSRAIRREIDQLTERVLSNSTEGKPVQVVFHFSGHGSQMSDQPEGDPDCDEEDGLDETLVPHDARQQGGQQDIRDDELNRFVDRICAGRRAEVWMVFDCCHSGTGVRGATKIRKLDRSVTPALPAAGTTRRVVRKRLPHGAVFLAACRAHEVEPEYRDGDESHGLLTRFLTEALAQETKLSSLSYDLLRKSIVTRYRQHAVVQAPSPQLEGSLEAIRGAVLAAGEPLDRRPFWRVELNGQDRSQVKLIAGAMHGVTIGSLYELYENPEQIQWHPALSGSGTSDSSAWLEIREIQGATADAKVFRWAEPEHREKIPAVLPATFRQGYAVERYRQHADDCLRVRVVQAIDRERDTDPLSPGDAAVPEPIRSGLQRARRTNESEWLRWTRGDEPCDLVIRFVESDAAIFPATGVASVFQRQAATRGGAPVPAALRGGWGPIDLTAPDEAAEHLADYLRRIARAGSLIRAAASQSQGGGSHMQVDLQLLSVELDDALQIRSAHPWPPDAADPPVMRQGDFFALRATNRATSGKPVYVTVLAIDPNMEIQVVLPSQEGEGLVDEQRLDPASQRTSDVYQCTDPPGPHYAILLATREPNEFHRLVQPGLPTTRSASRWGIDELLFREMYFQTRGGRRPRPQKLVDDSWSSVILRWDAQP